MSIGEIHTFSNYFTVALVLLGIVFEMLGRRKNNDGATSYAWNCLRLGFGFALLSLFTGFAADKADAIPSEAQTSAMFHQVLSVVFITVLTLLIAIRMIFSKKLFVPDSGAFLRGIYTTLQVSSLVLILITLFLGVRLVRVYGVGVRPVMKMNQLPAAPPPASGNIKVDTTEYLQ